MIIDHWMLQGKGGVGKTVNCSFLAQYLREAGVETHCFDTDPVNPTLTAYTALQTERIAIVGDDNNVDQRRFDVLIERLAALPDGSQSVIDNGASSFLPLCAYLKSADIFELLRANGHTPYLHTVLTGGQAFLDTVGNMRTLYTMFPSYPIIVWLTLKDGDLEYKGTPLEETEFWKECQPHIYAQVNIPELGKSTFGVDLQNLFSRRQTFVEALGDTNLSFMERHRLATFWKTLQSVLVTANL